jgi:hypothetical protein
MSSSIFSKKRLREVQKREKREAKARKRAMRKVAESVHLVSPHPQGGKP